MYKVDHSKIQHDDLPIESPPASLNPHQNIDRTALKEDGSKTPVINAFTIPPTTIASQIDSDDPLEILMKYKNLIVREKSLVHWDEVEFGSSQRSQFSVSPWIQTMTERLDEKKFVDSPIMEIRESSSYCCLRRCCLSDRETKYAVYRPLPTTGIVKGWPPLKVAKPFLVINKPFSSSLPCCCLYGCMDDLYFSQPKAFAEIPNLECVSSSSQDVSSHGIDDVNVDISVDPKSIVTDKIGYVVLDWMWWNYCWPFTFSYSIYDGVQNTTPANGINSSVPYKVDVACCYGGGNFNCCAPSCCNYNMRMPITDPSGDKVGEIQNQFSGCGEGNTNSYVIKFPNNSDSNQRATLLTALMLINLNVFEKRKCMFGF